MKKLSSFIYAILLLSSFGACKGEGSEQIETQVTTENGILLKITKEQFSSSGMRLDTIGRAAFPKVVSANGMLDVAPNNRATINAFLGGYVKDFPLLIGDKVRKGQKLLTLENLEFLELQQQYLEAGQRLRYLEAEYERQKQLYEEKINSQKVFMKAENEYDKIKILREGLRKKLMMIHIDPEQVSSDNMRSTTAIYSPITGSVTGVFVNSGTHISPDEPIMEIVNSDHMHLEIQVYEKDALRIEEGQKIRFIVPEYSDKSFSAEVHLIGRSVDQDRTVKVHAELSDDQKEKFIPGMFIKAEIQAEEIYRPAFALEAFTHIDGKSYLIELVNENDSEYIFRKIEVDQGEERNGFVEVNLPESLNNKQYLIGFNSKPAE